MSQALSFNQIRAEVAALRRKKPIEKPVAIRSAGRWLGAEVQADGDTTYAIAQCDSPLALRLALKFRPEGRPDAASGAVVRVVVTSLSDAELSPDIFSRLHKQRVFSIDRWSLVQQQFAAESIDPRLVQHDWLADAVVEHLGGRRTAAAKSGFLDAETLWRELLAATIGLTADVPDLAALLRWSLDGDHVRRFRGLPEKLKSGVEAWITGRAGDAAGFVFAVAGKSDRPDAVPLALAAGVLVDKSNGAAAERAIGKLEGGWLAGRRLDVDTLRRVEGEAAALFRTHIADPIEQRRITARAEELLREVDGSGFAHSSPILPLGYAQRLSALAEAVRRYTLDADADIDAVEQAAERVRKHDQSHANPVEAERLEMAMRLVRWLGAVRQGDGAAPASLADAARGYLAEGGWVDWARASAGRLAASRELTDAIAAVHAAASREQERRAGQFAALLEGSVTMGVYSAEVLLIEQVLDEVVANIACVMPVLLIVLDGMSAAVCRELVADMREKEGWTEIVEEGRTAIRPALATIPSETKYSRASLLAGRLTAVSPDEKTAFAAHAGLVAASEGGRGPVLYTKAELHDSHLSDVVRDEIASPKRRVVGAIVNAVDDHLAKADQIDVGWTLGTIRVLSALLHEAAGAGRAVILTSDHGHILEGGTTARVTDGGERWRPISAAALATDEVQLRGSRVLTPEGSLVTSFSEKVRYIAGTKRGYHGGVNPQEMVVPISVVIPPGVKEAPTGWQLAPESTPVWWDREGRAALVAAPAPVKKPPGMLFNIHRDEPKPGVGTGGGSSTTTAGEALPDQPEWVREVFRTEVFAAQKKLVPRGYPGDQILEQLLTHLDARGGKLTLSGLARVMGYATVRLPGLLAMAQRVFNVDGYPIVSVDPESDTVQFEKQLLLVQFGLPAGAEATR